MEKPRFSAKKPHRRPRQLRDGGESVKILGKRYRIVRHVIEGEDGKYYWGRTTHSNKLIEVRSDHDDDVQSETLLHEVVHCIDASLGLGLTEKQVSGLAGGLFAVVVDNRLGRRWLDPANPTQYERRNRHDST